MKQAFCIAVLVASCFTPVMHAQTAASACPATSTIDELVKALDDAVSGPADKDRTCLRELILPEGRLIPMSKGPDGKLIPRILTVDGWIDRVKARGKEVLSERQVKYSVDVYGQIAHLWTTYELHLASDDKATIRGINSIQAVYDGTQWKVIEILWKAESPSEPVPQKYLP